MREFLKELFTKRKKYDFGYILSLSISILLALGVGAAIMLILGYNPLEGYGALIKGAFGSTRALGDTLAKSVTLAMTALAMAVAAKAGMFNVGGEGQLFLGAMAAAVMGAVLMGVSPIIAIPVCMLAAIIAGGVYAYIPAILKVRLGVNEVITTIMMNSIAIYLCVYLSNGPLKTAEKGIASGTQAIDPDFKFTKLITNSTLTQSIFIAAIIAVVIWYLMSKTSQGYEQRLTGQNFDFSKYSGLKTKRIAIISMIISGAMCGLVGMFEVFGMHGRFIESISKDFYFDGMLVAMIMRYNPIGIVIMSVFFAALKMGSTGMEMRVGISSELILVVQSIIIFFMAAENGISKIIKEKAAIRKARREYAKAGNT